MNANKIPSPTTAALRSLAGLLENGGQTPLRQTPLGQTPPPTAPAAAVQAAAELRGVLAAKNSEAEVTLMRRQLSQLTSDFQFNLKLLEDRDLELERAEAVMSGLKESAAAKELALADTKRLLAEKDTALREKEARVAALEERQRQTMDLCERQVADARSSRDEQIAKLEAQRAAAEQQMLQRIAAVESIAAREKADIIAGYEKQLTAAVASEREARAAAAQAWQESEASRAALRRAEAKVAELELAAQRMVTQFEASLQALQTLEGQYSSLAAEAAEERRTAAGHIRQLELEVESLRAAKAVLQDEQDTMVNSLAQQLQERERQLSEAKQRYHHASLDNADLTEALTHAKAELQQARSRAEQLESDLVSARGQSSQAQAAAERERTAHAQTRGLLDTTRLQLETARWESEAQAQELMQLKEAAAVLDAQRGDTNGALEAARAKLRSAEERVALLGEQMEQERAAHAQALSSQEAQLRAQAERSLAAVHGDKAALQQALDQANRQLQQAYQELETLRLQLDHARLAPPRPSGAPSAAAAAVVAAAGGSGEPALSGAQHGSGSSNDRGGRQGLGPGAWADDHSELIGAVYDWKDREAAAVAGAGTGAEGSSAGALAGLQGQHLRGLALRGRYPNGTGAAFPSSEIDGASSISGDVFSDVASLDGGDGNAARQGLQPPTAAAGGRGAGTSYQQQQQQLGERGGRQATHLHRHLDSLASKLSSYERAAERARHAGTLAATEIARSAEELPQSLQRRQVEVAEDVLKRKLAREREKFLKERSRLDEELRRRELLMAEQEEELRKLHKEREEEATAQRQAELREKERELRQLAQQLQERQQQSAGAVLAASSAPASSAATMPHSPVQRPPATAAAATAPASLAGTAPASPAHQLAQQRQHVHAVAGPSSTGNAALLPLHFHQPQQQQQQQAAQPRTAPSSSNSAPLTHSLLQQQQQLRGPLQRASAASSLAQQSAGAPLPTRLAGLRASGASVSGLSAPTSGASSLRSSLAAGQLGSGGWAAASQGPMPGLQQQLAPGATPRGSVESLYMPPSVAGAAAAGPRLGSYTTQSSPRPASGLAGVAGAAAPVGGLGASGRGVAAGAAAGAAGPAGEGGGEDPLAKARRQVMLAKDYLRQVAEMGGKLARGAD